MFMTFIGTLLAGVVAINLIVRLVTYLDNIRKDRPKIAC